MNVFGFDIIREPIRKQVFKQCMSTRSDAFSFLICLDAIKFVLLSVCTLIEMTYSKIWAKPLFKNAKSPLPVDVRG